MSDGSSYSLSLLKTKGQALLYTVLTLKHYWYCITFICELSASNGHSIKKKKKKKSQSHLFKAMKDSFFFFPPSQILLCFLNAEKKNS